MIAPNHLEQEIDILEKEVARLRSIITDARDQLQMPTDPDCPKCGGYGEIYNEHSMTWDCECKDVYRHAMKMVRDEYAREAKTIAEFEAKHGHKDTEPCQDGCPDRPLPF